MSRGSGRLARLGALLFRYQVDVVIMFSTMLSNNEDT